MSKKIRVYLDGGTTEQINDKYPVKISGYTFNPSLFKKNKVKDYLSASKKLAKLCKSKSLSLEVFADDENNMIRQAQLLKSLSKNIYVKIPIVFTNGKSTKKVICNLANQNIKMNITAIFHIDQVKEILEDIKNTNTILSVFVGRLNDSGLNGYEIMKKINKFVHKNSKCETLWASPRQVLDLKLAQETQTDIITMQSEMIKKIKLFGKNPIIYSKETVTQFYNDAKSCKYKI